MYFLLTASIIPRPIALVTSKSASGIINAAPFSFFNAVSGDPPTLMLAIDRRNGEMKDTSHNIVHHKEFVVNVVTEGIATQMNITSGNYPRAVSEVQEAGFTLIPSTKISVPRIAESPIHFECMLSQRLEIGNGPTDLILGEIFLMHVDDKMFDAGRIDPRKVHAIGRLSGSQYCTTTEILEMRRPP